MATLAMRAMQLEMQQLRLAGLKAKAPAPPVFAGETSGTLAPSRLHAMAALMC